VENGKVNHASLHKYIRLVSDYWATWIFFNTVTTINA
jgi:hypothetical protein